MTQRFMTSVVFIFVLLSWPALAEPLNVQFTSEPTQYDPLFMEDGSALKLSANVIGTLYEYDGAGNLQKSLVDQMIVAKGKKKITLKFKKNLKWSDGVKFHAEQFIAALQRLAKEPIKGALSELFPEIDLTQTRALDALTAVVCLKTPDALFSHWLTLPPFGPIRPEMLEAFAKRNPVVPSLAAYQVAEYKREDYLLLKKNPEYRVKESVEIEQIRIRFLKDEATLMPMLKSGSLDILNKVPVLQLEDIRKIAKITEQPAEAVTYLGLNTKKSPFNDIKNRRAFRDTLFGAKKDLAEILKTNELVANTFLPHILIPGNLLKITHQKQTEEVKKFEFFIQSDSGSRNQTMLEFVQDKIKDELNWKVRLNLLDWKAHYSKIKSDPDEAYRFGWLNPVSDPFVTYQMLLSKSTNNFTGWSNAEYDQLVAELRQETKIVKKVRMIQRIEEILEQEAPIIPLLHQVLRFASSKRVIGFRANPFGVILFRELHLAKN